MAQYIHFSIFGRSERWSLLASHTGMNPCRRREREATFDVVIERLLHQSKRLGRLQPDSVELWVVASTFGDGLA
jgi:hypothetical protein